MTTFGNCIHYPQGNMPNYLGRNVMRGIMATYGEEPGSTMEQVFRQMSERHVRNRTVHLLLGEMGSFVSKDLSVAFNVSMLPPLYEIGSIHDIVTAIQIHAAQPLQTGVQPAMSTYKTMMRVYNRVTRQVSHTIGKPVMVRVAQLLNQVMLVHPDDPAERNGQGSAQADSVSAAARNILRELEATLGAKYFVMARSIEKGLVDGARVELMQSAVDWSLTANVHSMRSKISQLSNNETELMIGGASLECSVPSSSVLADVQARLHDGVMQSYMRNMYSMAKDPLVFLNSLIAEGKKSVKLVGAMDEGAYVVPGLGTCASGNSLNSKTGVGLTNNGEIVLAGEEVPVSAVLLLSRKAYDDLVGDSSRGVQQMGFRIESGQLVMKKKVYLKPVDEGLLKKGHECDCKVDTFYDKSDDEMCRNDYPANEGAMLQIAAKTSMGQQGLRSVDDLEKGLPVPPGVFVEDAGKRMLLGLCEVQDEDDMVKGKSDRGGDVDSVKTTEQKRSARKLAYTKITQKNCLFMADLWNGRNTAVLFSRMEEDVNATTVDVNNRSSALTPRKSSFMVAPTHYLKDHGASQWRLYTVLFGGGKYERSDGDGKLETLTSSQGAVLDCFPDKAVGMPDGTRIFMIGHSSTNGHTGGFRGCNGATVTGSGPPASKRMCVSGLNGGIPNCSVRNESLVTDKTTHVAAFADEHLYRVGDCVTKLNESMATLVEQRGTVTSSEEVKGLRQVRKKMVTLLKGTARKEAVWTATRLGEGFKPGTSKNLIKLRDLELYPFHDLAYDEDAGLFSLQERRFMHRVPLEDMSCMMQRALHFMNKCGREDMTKFARLMDAVVEEASYVENRGQRPAGGATEQGFSADRKELPVLPAANMETGLGEFAAVPVVGNLYNAAKCLVEMCKNKFPNPAGNMACWQTTPRATANSQDVEPVKDFNSAAHDDPGKDVVMGQTLYGMMSNLIILPAAFHGKVDVLVRGRTVAVANTGGKEVAFSYVQDESVKVRRNDNASGDRFYTYMNNEEAVTPANFFSNVQDLPRRHCEAFFNAVTQMKLNLILRDTSLSPHLKAIMLMTEFSDLTFATHKDCVEKGYHTGLGQDLVNMETHFSETAIYAPAQSHEMIVMPKTTFDPVANPGSADGTPQALDITARTTTFTTGNGLPTSAVKCDYVVPNENLVTAKTRDGLHPLVCFDHVPNHDELASIDAVGLNMASERGRADMSAKAVGEFVSEYVKENPAVFNNEHDGGDRRGGGAHELENLPRPKFVAMLRPMMSTGPSSNLCEHNTQNATDSAPGGFPVMGRRRLLFGWGHFFMQECASMTNPYAGTLCGLYFTRYGPDREMVDHMRDRTVSMRTFSSEVHGDNGLGSQKCSDTTVWLKFLYNLSNRPVMTENEVKAIESACDRYGMSKTTKQVPLNGSECRDSHNETRRRVGLTRCANHVAQMGCAIPYTVNGMGSQTENSKNSVLFTGFSEGSLSNFQVLGPFAIE